MERTLTTASPLQALKALASIKNLSHQDTATPIMTFKALFSHRPATAIPINNTARHVMSGLDTPPRTSASRARPQRLLQALVITLAATSAACTSQPNNHSDDHPQDEHGWQQLAWIESEALDEISGLAQSTRADDLIWAHNDSGGDNYLYAIDYQGRTRGRVASLGIGNRDWEDLATFHWRGGHWLLIGDVGDNSARHDSLRLHILPEPTLPTSAELAAQEDPHIPSMRINARVSFHIRFPDGPRDCESVAVDPEREEILLLSKRDVPARLYRVPLSLDRSIGVQTAEFIGTVDHIPQPGPEAHQRDPRLGRWSAQPTALDLAPDGRSAAVLTYYNVYLFDRADGQSWGEALAGTPRILPLPALRQAESLTYDGNQHLVVSSEKLPAPLYTYALP